MKRFITIFIILNFSFLLRAQEIIYSPVFIDQCTDSIAEFQYWWISDKDSIYNIDSFPSSIILPKLGKYSLSFDIGEEPQIIYIESSGERIDTFYTKRVELAIYVSNPPFSEFFDCGNLANGQITDYYYNGNIRLTCTFKNGQPIDSLKRFYRNGVMSELYVPKKRKRQQISYYPNGQIREDFNHAKRYSIEYYKNGEVKEISNWNRSFRKSDSKKYDQNGNIRIWENNKNQTKYYSNGILQSHTTKKEVMILEKIFTKYGTPHYEFECSLFDSVGSKLAFLNYSGNMGFPKNISEIKAYQYHKIIFYENEQESQFYDFYKIEYDTEKYRIVRQLLDFLKENKVN